MIGLLLTMSTIGWLMTILQVPQDASAAMLSLTSNKEAYDFF